MSLNLIGTLSVEAQWHGTQHGFEDFDQSHLKSLGFHFGNIEQAKYFAGIDGWLYKANLRFQRLLDIGDQDWGWTSLQHIALAFFASCNLSGIHVNQADFEPFLGPLPWNLVALAKTSELSSDDQLRLSSLFAAYQIDGIRYVNKFEPPNHAGGTAYFVLRSDQIELIKSPTIKGRIPAERSQHPRHCLKRARMPDPTGLGRFSSTGRASTRAAILGKSGDCRRPAWRIRC